MAKIMLVEDDNNLREIYEARLLAEGYQIVAAKDGEEALALAVKEKPDLIIADVMMPKISGFDMLDILRSTPETRDTKVVMMTALSQAEDKARAEKLGADRYLVKSQVTLEDVAKVAHEVLQSNGTESMPTPPAEAATSSTPSTPPTQQPTTPIAVTPSPIDPSPTPLSQDDDPTNGTPTEPDTHADPPASDSAGSNTPPDDPSTTQGGDTTVNDFSQSSATGATSIDAAQPEPTTIPITSDDPETDTGEAADKDAPLAQPAISPELTQTTATEEAVIDKQISDFIDKQSTISTTADEPTKTPQEGVDTATTTPTSPSTGPSTATQPTPDTQANTGSQPIQRRINIVSPPEEDTAEVEKTSTESAAAKTPPGTEAITHRLSKLSQCHYE